MAIGSKYHDPFAGAVIVDIDPIVPASGNDSRNSPSGKSLYDMDSAKACDEFQSDGRIRFDASLVLVPPVLFPTVTVPFQSAIVSLLMWLIVAVVLGFAVTLYTGQKTDEVSAA